MKKLFVIVGKTCAGKDTFISYARKYDVPVIVSATNRPPREGEIDGINYNFLTKEQMIKLIMEEKLYAHTSYKVATGETWHYGILKEDLEKYDYAIVILNPDGLKELKELYGDKIVSILIHSNEAIRISRCLNREEVTIEKMKEYCRRFLADEEDFNDIEVDYLITNNRRYAEDNEYKLIKIILKEVMNCN